MIVNQAALVGIGQSFSTLFAEAFAGVEDQAALVATEVPSTGSETNYKWLGNFPTMRKWVGDRVIANLKASDYTLKNESFEATIGVDREDIDDDNLGVYSPVIREMAHNAAVHPSQLVYSLLLNGFSEKCYDGQYFFDTDHPVGDGETLASVSNFGGGTGTPWFLLDLSRPIKPMILQRRKQPEFVAMDNPTDENVFMRKKYLYGVDDRKKVGFGLWQLAYASKDTLDATNYEAAKVAMGTLKNDQGLPLGVRGTHLAVGPTLEAAAKAVIKAERLENGASNTLFNDVDILVIPWLG